MDLGERPRIQKEYTITYAIQPLGEVVDSVLEARECISHDDVLRH